MNVAVAEMAEGDDPRAGREIFDRLRRLSEEGGHGADWNRDVMLDRGAFANLRLGNAVPQLPEILALAERRGTRGALDDSVFERRCEAVPEGLVTPAAQLTRR